MTGDPEPLTEPTPEGAQIVVPGIRPVTLRDRLALRAAQPMAPRRKPNIPQKPCNVGLFDIDARRQTDLLDLLRAAASGAFPAPEPKE